MELRPYVIRIRLSSHNTLQLLVGFEVLTLKTSEQLPIELSSLSKLGLICAFIELVFRLSAIYWPLQQFISTRCHFCLESNRRPGKRRSLSSPHQMWISIRGQLAYTPEVWCCLISGHTGKTIL